PGDVLIYWQFSHRAADGTDVFYDTAPAGTAQTFCPQSGVEFVTIRDTSGRDIDRAFPTFNCVNELGDQGVIVRAVRPGSHTWVITGYRGDPGVALYEATFSFTVASDRRTVIDSPPVTLTAIQNDLVLEAQLRSLAVPPDPGQFFTCGAAGVSRLTYSLVDFFGTELAFGDLPCPGPAVRPSVTIPALARDNYAVRMQGFAGPSPTPVFDTVVPVNTTTAPVCGSDPVFDHLDNDAVTVSLFDLRSIVGGATCP
ncbi:MAG TPA: hypothetical protein VFK85_00420, partial [Anaeromyxobacteraceae bacterium]|nr:hypothetical protein [Anaeromyxobacteraceae bacterium]